MEDPTVDRFHCYECGSTDVAHASLFPLAPVVVEGADDSNTKGHTLFVKVGDRTLPHPLSQKIPGTKSSWDFNVCTPCYLNQRKRRYPDDDFTLGEQKLRMNAEIHRLRQEYAEAQQLEWARKILAEHESKLSSKGT